MVSKSNNRSGGPKTKMGRSIASKNSTRTGVYATQIILPGERLEDFQELENLFIDDFQPKGVTEAALVHELAVITWKRRRLDGLEHRELMHELEADLQIHDCVLAGFSMREGFEVFYNNPYLVDECDVSHFAACRTTLQAFLLTKMDVDALTELKSSAPAVYDQLVLKMKKKGMQDDTPSAVAGAVYTCVPFPEENHGFPLKDAVNAVIAEADKIIWAWDNRDRLISIRAHVRDLRLAAKMGNERHQRSYDHLARTFYKTLSELRKQQEWRGRLEVIDVTPLGTHENT